MLLQTDGQKDDNTLQLIKSYLIAIFYSKLRYDYNAPKQKSGIVGFVAPRN